MACVIVDRVDVPEPPHRVLNGVIDEDDKRWRFKDGLLVAYIRYTDPKTWKPDELPWAAMWSQDDARR
jgi:hypothetical protein